MEPIFNKISPLLPIKEDEKEWKGNFLFIQGSDPQFGLIQYFRNPHFDNWDEEIELAEKAVKVINDLEPRPRFFVICGDLINAFPDYKPDIRKAQLNTFIQIFSKVHQDIPIVCVCGNHDVGNKPSSSDIALYRKTFGPDFFTFWCGGLFFIVVNTQYWEYDKNCKPESEEHEAWIKQICYDCKVKGVKRAVIFQHIPWFTSHIDEEHHYFTLPKEIRKVWLDLFQESGIKAIFCGHYHRNAGGLYNNMELIVTSAIGAQLGSDKPGLRIVKVYEEKIEHKYYKLDEFPKKIEF